MVRRRRVIEERVAEENVARRRRQLDDAKRGAVGVRLRFAP